MPKPTVLERRVGEAIKLFWTTRDSQSAKQGTLRGGEMPVCALR